MQETQVPISGSGGSSGVGNGNPLQYSCLENFMNRGTWWATVHGVAKSWTQLEQLIGHTYSYWIIVGNFTRDKICRERIALKHVYYHMWNRSLVQVQCMKQGTQGPCTGTTLGDGMGREEGAGFRMGAHVHSWLIHVNVYQKPLQYCN